MKADWIKYKPGLCFFSKNKDHFFDRFRMEPTISRLLSLRLFLLLSVGTHSCHLSTDDFHSDCVGVLHVAWTMTYKGIIERLHDYTNEVLFERNGWWLWKKCTINFDNTAEINTVDAVRERFNDSGGATKISYVCYVFRFVPHHLSDAPFH